MLLFFFDETQMVDIWEKNNHLKCFLMKLKPTVIMISNLSFCTEAPCRLQYIQYEKNMMCPQKSFQLIVKKTDCLGE